MLRSAGAARHDKKTIAFFPLRMFILLEKDQTVSSHARQRSRPVHTHVSHLQVRNELTLVAQRSDMPVAVQEVGHVVLAVAPADSLLVSGPADTILIGAA